MSLDQRIKNWRKSLRKHAALEDGFVEELETHLRDQIDVFMHNGLGEEEAFDKALEKLGSIDAIDHDEKIAVKLSSSTSFLGSGLLSNFIKVSRRQYLKNGLLNSINLAGLTIAFSVILFIGLFINDELSFERHHPDAEKIHRLGYEYMGENGVSEKRAYTSGMWVDVIKDGLPEIEDATRFLTLSYGYIRNEQKNESYYEENIYWSDSNFFDFFKFDFKLGDPQAQLKNLSSVILTESVAKMHFGDENPIGQSLQYIRQGNTVNFTVTGVIYDPPSNTQFQPKYIAHIDASDAIYGEQSRGWAKRNPNPGYVFSFLKLSEESGKQKVHDYLNDFWKTAIPEQAEFMTPTLVPLVDIHFNPPIKWEQDNPISMSYIYGLLVIGAFILVIAMTNFVNLTTAQGSKRQKEIGLRKTLGSSKKNLRLQFFLESAFLTILSILAAIGVVIVLLPGFNAMIEKNINLGSIFSSPITLSALVLVSLLMASLAGTFPAFYFTRHLRNGANLDQYFKTEKAGASGRSAMVILQFAVAITLIICTVTVFNQLQLINNGKLGENREAVIGIRTSRMGTDQQAQRYINEIKSLPRVDATTLGMHLPRQSDFGRINTKYFIREVDDEARFWNKFDADGGFAKTYDLEILAGSDFRENYDTTSYLLNEAAVKELGISPAEAIGLFIKEDSIEYTFDHSDGVVIGVVKDFAYKSIKQKVEPLVIAANTLGGGVLSVKLGEGEKQGSIAELNDLWNEIYPGRPFEYWFLDKEFDRLYKQERKLGKLIPIFSGLAITIALFGLFALTAYVSDLRKKEIGIRKVLGCSSAGILKLLSLNYMKTIMIAVLIGIPLAWFGMDYWLSNFTYRVSVSLLVVLASVGLIILLALFTVSIKSLRAANSNPVDSLKYE